MTQPTSPMDGTIWNLCGYTRVVNPVELKEFFLKQLGKAGFKILNSTEHHFSPYGYTSLELLAESHFAIHTFPENGVSYFELSSCLEEKFITFAELLYAHSDSYLVVSTKTIKLPEKFKNKDK